MSNRTSEGDLRFQGGTPGSPSNDDAGQAQLGVTITKRGQAEPEVAEPDRTLLGGITAPQNKELKLTKPSRDGASQLNSVFGGQLKGGRGQICLSSAKPNPGAPNRPVKRFVWAITPLATILLSLGVGGCAVAVGVLGWADYAAMQRATKARELIVPGMTIDQAKAATADLGELLMPELHPPHPPRAVFWAHGGLLGGDYRVIVVLDDRQRVVSTEPPLSDSVD